MIRRVEARNAKRLRHVGCFRQLFCTENYSLFCGLRLNFFVHFIDFGLLWPNRFEIAADRLSVAERNRLCIEYRVIQFLRLLEFFSITALSRLAAFGGM